MTNKELAAALRLCGSEKPIDDCPKCPFFEGYDPKRCIPKMTAACADALENSESHVAALQKEIEGLRAQNKKLQAIATELQSKSQWVSVTERMPEDYIRVLTNDGRGNTHIFSHSKALRFPFGIGPNNHRYYQVTHWMPLPEPPEEEE